MNSVYRTKARLTVGGLHLSFVARLAFVACVACVACWSVACSSDSDGDEEENRETTSYWRDVVPIFEEQCLHCHQEGGIAPFRLDDYAEAAKWSGPIAAATRAGTMPPWYATNDGSCGEFSNALELSEAQIATLETWDEAGAPEGARDGRSVELPPLPEIDDPVEYRTPRLVPEIQGGELAAFDEYRCFPLDTELDATKFITAYDVRPGNPAIVHHVIAYIVDPAGESQTEGVSNAETMEALDAESPDREGWPCFADAGDGINMNAATVTWAPGQGKVEFPGESGVLILPQHKLVVQMHYNLADPETRGEEDQTTIQFQMADVVPNVGTMLAEDALLASLYEDEPMLLEPGNEALKVTWREKFSEALGAGVPEFQLWGFMPHMHELGRSYRLSILTGDESTCGVQIDNWDFNWQRTYFLKEPFVLTPDAEFEVECVYDTSSRSEPISPGWGTRNEMCTGIMYVTFPLF